MGKNPLRIVHDGGLILSMGTQSQDRDSLGRIAPEREAARAQDGADAEELKPEEVARSKRMARINAATMALVFLVIAFAPAPYRLYAPVLFLLPFAYRIYTYMKRPAADGQRTELPRTAWEIPDTPHEEPYSHKPRDSRDPRRYKPIG